MAIGFECAASAARGQTFGATSLRYFNVAGASGDYGELHDPETHLIPLVLRVAAGLRESVQIYGTDYPTDDGTAVRDYIHVEDLARAHLLALDAITPGAHAIYNLGNGTGFSVRQVVEACRAVTGHPIPAVEVGRRAGDPAVLVASSDKIRRALGWVPEKPSLEAMVGDAWNWIQANRAPSLGSLAGPARPPQGDEPAGPRRLRAERPPRRPARPAGTAAAGRRRPAPPGGRVSQRGGASTSSMPTSRPRSRSTVAASAAVGRVGRTTPWKCSHSGFSSAWGCTAVISTTTRRRAWSVRAATNGTRSPTL